MTIKLASLKADLDKEREGDWVDYPDWPGVRFNVRSLQTPSYAIKRDQLITKLARRYGRKPIPVDVRAKEFGRLYADEILLDWEGFDTEYSHDNAVTTLTDPAFREIVAAVEWCASQLGEIDAEFIDESVKKSEPPSATT